MPNTGRVNSPEKSKTGHIHGARNTPREEVGGIADNLKQYINSPCSLQNDGTRKSSSQALQDARPIISFVGGERREKLW